jgi:4'-phosphopantetheinyl transferase
MKAAPAASHAPPWRAPPETSTIDPNEVHVWRAALDQTPLQIQDFHHRLAADEQDRAARLCFEKDREHFIAARGVLRDILGRYLNRAPESLSFRYGSHGKPALAGDSDEAAIRFNVSHSQGLALYAVTQGREVGIDLEHVRSELAVAEIAERFFSPREIATLRTLPALEQRPAFFRCWTRKEAYIKARGEGLSTPLSEFDVSLAPGEPAELLGTRQDPSEALRWSLQDLDAAPGFAAALAVEGRGGRLSCCQWRDSGRQSV